MLGPALKLEGVSASCLRVDSSHCSKPGVTKHGHLRTSISLCGLVWAQVCSLRALVLQVRCSEDGSGFFCRRKCGCFTECQVASCPGSRCCLVEQNLQVSSYTFHVLSVRRWPGLLVSPYLGILMRCGPVQPFLLVDHEMAFAHAESPASGLLHTCPHLRQWDLACKTRTPSGLPRLCENGLLALFLPGLRPFLMFLAVGVKIRLTCLSKSG